MSKFKGTPGPWSLCYDHPDCPEDIAFIREAGNVGYSVLDIASIYGTGDKDLNKDIHRADARLIAAAPELLEALQGALKAWDAVYPSMKFDGDVETLEDFEFREFQKARSAILKALGQDAQD